MANYLLDSNAFFWAKRFPNRLKREALAEIQKAENQFFVSAAAVWELAIKAAKGKLEEFARMMDEGPDALQDGLAQSRFTLLPIQLNHISVMYRLPRHHRDPFDRLMIAQAISEGLTIVTSDSVFARYNGLHVLAA